MTISTSLPVTYFCLPVLFSCASFHRKTCISFAEAVRLLSSAHVHLVVILRQDTLSRSLPDLNYESTVTAGLDRQEFAQHI